MRAREKLLGLVDEQIAGYNDRFAALSSAELAALKLDKNGICYDGDCALHNAILSSRLGGEQFSRELLQDMCVMFLVAGYDTTATTITSMAYLAARGHDHGAEPPPTAADTPFMLSNSLWRDLITEQESAAARHGKDNAIYDEPTAALAALQDMPYLAACMKETMRLNPPVRELVRKLNADV